MELVIKCKGENYIVLIDEEDYDRVSKHTWHISHQPHTKYCSTHIKINGKKTTLQLHRFLMNLVNGEKKIINHKDGNGLNNMKSNLEICDHNYNNQSINTKKNFGSIYIIKNTKKKYEANVYINKKRYRKCFYTWEEAQAYLDTLKEIAIAETLPFNNN